MKHFKPLIWSALFALFFLVSCTEEKEVEAPNGLLSEQEMVEILTEISKVEARFQRRLSIRGSNNEDLVSHNYSVIFDAHGITMEQYKTSFEYYEQSPKAMQIIFDSVIVRLTEEQSVIESIYYDSTEKK
jgi:hypothetical protein